MAMESQLVFSRRITVSKKECLRLSFYVLDVGIS